VLNAAKEVAVGDAQLGYMAAAGVTRQIRETRVREPNCENAFD